MTRAILTLAAAAMATGAAAQQAVKPTPARPSYRDLKFPPLAEVRIPEIATFTLANGMKVYLLENRELPLVSGFALVRTGNLFEPTDKVGLAQLTGMVMRTGGTKSKTGDQIDEELESMAASVECAIGETSGSVSFNALRENTADVLAAFQDLLTTPEFRQDKLDLAKTQLRGFIARRNDDADSISAREFSEILYGRQTPYGRRMEYEHVQRIARDDLVAFHRRYFFPANILLAIQGDFSASAMRAQIEKLFGGWNSAQPPVPPFPRVDSSPKPGVYLAAKDDVEQTFFALGHLGGMLKDADYPALAVMSDILGGGFSSRLFKKVRTELGLAYSVSGGWGAEYNHPGLFQIAGSTKSASTVDTLRAVRAEIDRIRTTEVTDQELDSAQQTVLNGFVFRFDRPAKTLNRLVTYEYWSYPKDFLSRYQKAIAAVTKADVLRVARQYLKLESMVIVAVGKPADFGKPLTELNVPVTDIDLTIPDPGRAPAKADAQAEDRGRKLLARVREAMGGDAKIAAVTDYEQLAEAQMSGGPGGALKATQRNRWMRPSLFRQDQELPFGKVSAYSDGKTGWLAMPQGTQPMPPPILEQVRNELFKVWFTLLLSDRDPERSVTEESEGVLVISGKAGPSVKMSIDPASGLPASLASTMGGRPIEEVYSDFRETGGIRLPHKITMRQNGQPSADVTIKEWRLNTDANAEDMGKKP